MEDAVGAGEEAAEAGEEADERSDPLNPGNQKYYLYTPVRRILYSL